MSRCPSRDDLRRLLADELRGPEADVVEDHLETCTDCQQQVEQMTGPKTEAAFLRRLQEQPAAIRPVRPQEQAETMSLEPAGQLRIVPAARRAPQSMIELQTLLRKRLLFIAGVTWLVFALFAMAFLPLFPDFRTVPIIVVMLSVLGGLVVLLWRQRRLSLLQLRWIELMVFASMGSYFLWLQFSFHAEGLLNRLAALEWPGVWLMARAFSFGWYAMIVLYGILIPNTLRRCAVVVGTMALCLVLTNAIAGFWDSAIEVRLHVLFVLESTSNMAMAVALAIYGAHRLETLRQQASQARKLGPYQLKQRLGSGGMGEVYLAEHGLLRRPCAVKLIRPERAGDPQFLRRFEREVQATATLNHPNTVEIFDYGRAEDGTFYYVMEYLPGLNLDELVQRHGPLPPERTIHLLRQVCGALREAHGIGLVHRDIKPGNILVCERGGIHDVVKLLDFGLVQAPEQGQDGTKLTQPGMIAGTPAYMSPEQAAGTIDVDARSDLYSLGAVAYYLLTGQPPFVRATAVQTLAAHLGEAPVPPSRLQPALPADLEAVVLRCLEKDPGRRFASSEALEQAL